MTAVTTARTATSQNSLSSIIKRSRDIMRKDAGPPHGGFGMGLSRVLMLLSNLREATYLFRGPSRLTP